MKKFIAILLTITLLLSTLTTATFAQEDWWNRDTYPTDLKNGQVLSENPYIMVERQDTKWGSVINIDKYIKWERSENDLLTYFRSKDIDPETGKVRYEFDTSPIGEDYFDQSSLDGYNKPYFLPPVWDRPLTDVQAKAQGVDPVIDPLYDVRHHWAFAEVFELRDLGAINGYNDGTFRPQNNITREEFLKVLAATMGLNTKDKSTNQFVDVGANWSNPYIAAALEKGIIKLEECPNNQFEPKRNITRLEMAVWIVRALGKENQAIDSNYTDTIQSKLTDLDTIDTKYVGYIKLANDLGIITGYDNGTFGANDPATRAQAAVMLVRMYHKLLGA